MAHPWIPIYSSTPPPPSSCPSNNIVGLLEGSELFSGKPFATGTGSTTNGCLILKKMLLLVFTDAVPRN